jgi:hypothetical protein
MNLITPTAGTKHELLFNNLPLFTPKGQPEHGLLINKPTSGRLAPALGVSILITATGIILFLKCQQIEIYFKGF